MHYEAIEHAAEDLERILTAATASERLPEAARNELLAAIKHAARAAVLTEAAHEGTLDEPLRPRRVAS